MKEKRIYIVGPSASGKTYLAKIIASKYRIPNVNLDYIFYKHVVDKCREEVSEREWKSKLNKILKGKGWVIEGVNPINEVVERADKIIYLRPNLLSALRRRPAHRP